MSPAEPKYLGHVLKVNRAEPDGTQAFDIVGRAMLHASGDIVIEPIPFSGCDDMVIFKGSLIDAIGRHKERRTDSASAEIGGQACS